MVQSALYLGGIVGVLLSGGFVYWEIGKFATPQVPRSLFDERKEMFAYTAGLFVGVPLAFVLLLFLNSMNGGFVLAGALEDAILIGGFEVAQWLLLRSVYFGTGTAGPFYALGFRAGIAGILVLAINAQYLGGPNLAVLGVGVVLAQSAAILALGVAGALLSLRAARGSQRLGGGPLSGAIVGAVGYYFLGLGAFLGGGPALVAAGVVAVGMWSVYVRLRNPILGRVRPPPEASTGVAEGAEAPAFGRTDRP